MNAQEEWRTVPSLPSHSASSWGRVRCEPFESAMPRGGVRRYGGKPTYGVWNASVNRYQTLVRGKNFKVARMVCEAFHGAPPQGKPVCMHLDENSRNNRPENLAWGSQKENLNALGFIELCKSPDRPCQVKLRDLRR